MVKRTSLLLLFGLALLSAAAYAGGYDDDDGKGGYGDGDGKGYGHGKGKGKGGYDDDKDHDKGHKKRKICRRHPALVPSPLRFPNEKYLCCPDDHFVYKLEDKEEANGRQYSKFANVDRLTCSRYSCDGYVVSVNKQEVVPLYDYHDGDKHDDDDHHGGGYHDKDDDDDDKDYHRYLRRLSHRDDDDKKGGKGKGGKDKDYHDDDKHDDDKKGGKGKGGKDKDYQDDDKHDDKKGGKGKGGKDKDYHDDDKHGDDKDYHDKDDYDKYDVRCPISPYNGGIRAITGFKHDLGYGYDDDKTSIKGIVCADVDGATIDTHDCSAIPLGLPADKVADTRTPFENKWWPIGLRVCPDEKVLVALSARKSYHDDVTLKWGLCCSVVKEYYYHHKY